jgi:integrase
MSRTPSVLPVYRHHKPTNQAVCTVRLANGGRKDLYLGKYNSAASKSEFGRIVSIISANGGIYPIAAPDLTINEALVRYTKFIKGYYVDLSGRSTGTSEDIKITLGYLKRLFGPTPLADFGPGEFKTVRAAMIEDDRVRIQVNKRSAQVRQFFKWCVEEQIVSPMVLEGIRAVRALDPGRSGVKEGKVVEPADPVAVEKAIPFMPPAVAAVVAILRYTGARPNEILSMRPCDLDRSLDVWSFNPPRHKTAWRGKKRSIYIGPEAKQFLSPWLLGVGPDELVFTPARSEQFRNRQRSEARKTPLRSSSKPKQNRQFSDRYKHRALSKAVLRACDQAGVTSFSPYQLRHLKAVELREQYGLEVARAVLGHGYKAMSDHYSKAADSTLATKAAREVG